jgi:D-alanyl-D-alanine carboxypeptidase
MNKWLFRVVLVIVVGFGLSKLPLWGTNEIHKPGSQTDALNSHASQDKPSLELQREDIYKGDLLLINLQHPVPKNRVPPDVVKLIQHPELMNGIGMLDGDIELPLDQLQRLSEMAEAARADGITGLMINSGYRGREEQAELYEELGSVYANPPGHSEHQLGLSLDLGSSIAMMKDAPEGEWLRRNAWKHGFVLRYPEDKTKITGVIYEPWHFRYVGLPHSAIMQEHGFVLEEYLEYLKDRKQVHAEAGGKAYEVSYYRVDDGAKIAIPIEGSYTISGNNTDGVIVTTWDAGISGTKGEKLP